MGIEGLGLKKSNAQMAVVGLGYVGLPLALEFAKKGFRTLGVDVDKDRVAHIRKRKSYITDITQEELRRTLSTGRFRVSNDFKTLKSADAVIICVPTPLKTRFSPDISFIRQAVESVGANLKKGALVVLESTTYPGTTEEVILPLLEKRGLRHGVDFYLAFSPERIDPGNEKYTVSRIPKVVGGISAKATNLAAGLYSAVIDRVVPVSSARVAETVKLLENTFRLVNIGMIDEMAMMAHKMGLNIWEIIEAAKTKPFGFMPFYPGPGVGGHCIPKDPLYLFWKARHHGFHSRFIKLASDIVSRMPEYVVQRVGQLLRARLRSTKGVRVLAIGVTYKKDVLDLRKSPALEVLEALRRNGYSVSYHDPIIPYLKTGSLDLKSVPLNSRTLKGYDCVVILTDHSSLDYRLIEKHARIVFDTRNALGNSSKKNIFRL